jgi:hypothetical protein
MMEYASKKPDGTLVNHHIRTRLLLLRGTSSLCLGWLVTVGSACLALVHLHVIISALLAFFLLIVFRVFNVNLLTASFGLGILVVGGACSILSACHGGILTLGSNTFALGLLGLLFFLFLNTILVSVCGEVGLWLLRGELRGCRLVGVPMWG